MRKHYPTVGCIFLIALFSSIIYSCKKDGDRVGDKPTQDKLLDNAKAWFKQQAQLETSKDSNDIAVGSYRPNWNKFKITKNSGGTDVIGIPLYQGDSIYMELNFYIIKGRNYGIIKKYNWANKEMMIYTGSGRLKQKGFYDPQTQKISVLERVKGTNSFKLAYEDEYYGGDLGGVTITAPYNYPPPPPTPYPDSQYAWPPNPVYDPYNPYYNPYNYTSPNPPNNNGNAPNL